VLTLSLLVASDGRARFTGRFGSSDMLGQRIVTAVVLLALLLPTLFVKSTWPFAVLMLVFIAAATWEWARLNGQPQRVALGFAALLIAAAALGTWVRAAGPVSGGWWWVALAAWITGGSLALRGGPLAWPKVPAVWRLAVGALALWMAWWAIAQARAMGVNFLLSVLCIVFAADICAYAAGRAFGRHKLAPSISPGKTWEGVAGGVVGVALLAAFWLLVIDVRVPVDSKSLFGELLARGGLAWMALAVVVLAGLSVIGDLFESLVKRAAGAKDSSRLLPGHGGVLDRIDAQLPVLPAALAFVSV
jgi:phosphatidate cytidylyltransferase